MTPDSRLTRSEDQRFGPGAERRPEYFPAKTNGVVKSGHDERAIETPDLIDLPNTDAGQAERLIRLHGQDLRYHAEARAWLIWSGGRWERDTKGVAEQLAIATARETYRQSATLPEKSEPRKALDRHARLSEQARAIRATLELARTIDGVTVGAEQLDSDLMILNCPNGVIDLRTGALRPHDRDDLITKMTGAEYSVDARCDTWLRFLRTAMGATSDASKEDVALAEQRVKFLQRAIGYSITGSTSEKAVLALFGPTDAGKTTFLETLKFILGTYAGQVLVESLMANARQSDANAKADLADLRGLRFVTTSEAEASQRLAEGRLKYLTQGQNTRIKSARKYENPIEFLGTHKLWIDANERPTIRTTDDSVWRRLKPVPFTRRVPADEIDRSLPATLRAEAQGILRWAVEGCLAWQRSGLGDPPDVRAARADWQAACDPTAEFFADACEFDSDSWCISSELVKRYDAWCAENGEKHGVSRSVLFERLKARGCLQSREYVANGTRQRGWKGISLA